MTIRFLLDTNILSEPLQLQPNTQVLERLKLYQQEVATASLVIHELVFGYQRLPLSQKRSRIERYVTGLLTGGLPIFSYDRQAAIWHGQMRASLMGLKQNLTPNVA
jgi:tRNA(fMet)-specific endonuclease VapC